MAKLLTGERIPVTVEGDENTVYILSKMDYGTVNKLAGAASSMRQTADGSRPSAEFDMGAYNLAILTLNVVAWQGPDFDGQPCTPENMARWDPDDALLKEVVRQIQERNGLGGVGADAREGTSPNYSANGNSHSKAKAKDIVALGSGRST